MKYPMLVAVLLAVVACQSTIPPADPRMKPGGHVDEPVPEAVNRALEIPPVVSQVPIIEPPKPAVEQQTFTVVATDVPASELLFALARDARLNLDIDPAITGKVSINAIDQTLPQILKRISRQVSLHYYVDGPNLVVQRDLPFVRDYVIDYLNIKRESSSNLNLSLEVGSVGGGGSGGGGDEGGSGSSSAKIKNTADNDFWETLEKNIKALAEVGGDGSAVVVNRESGLISVNTTAAAHDSIRKFVDRIMSTARKQVLIEATVVEVTLNDDFQAGVDWSKIAVGDGWSFEQSSLNGALGTGQFLSGTYTGSNSKRNVNAAIRALDSFGDVSVMSSPKIMTLNNQTSILKVVDNTVYFNFDVSRTISDSGAVNESFNTSINTVPVGLVMNVTPFITSSNEVILNVRPSISRILGFVNDPNPELAQAGVVSPIPQIQVREMESVLRVASGDTAVIGGLMQDSLTKASAGVPGLHEVEGFGLLFGTQEQRVDKTELVIFLRPRVIDSASLESDLGDFQKYLKPRLMQETGAEKAPASNDSE